MNEQPNDPSLPHGTHGALARNGGIPVSPVPPYIL